MWCGIFINELRSPFEVNHHYACDIPTHLHSVNQNNHRCIILSIMFLNLLLRPHLRLELLYHHHYARDVPCPPIYC